MGSMIEAANCLPFSVSMISFFRLSFGWTVLLIYPFFEKFLITALTTCLVEYVWRVIAGKYLSDDGKSIGGLTVIFPEDPVSGHNFHKEKTDGPVNGHTYGGFLLLK